MNMSQILQISVELESIYHLDFFFLELGLFIYLLIFKHVCHILKLQARGHDGSALVIGIYTIAFSFVLLLGS